ncbi:MAG: thioredoxin family protein [Deltaproteobacteria bacterium]|nr:thioredoxin family protein [Deltaproteobacteria bacterium]
MNPALPGGAPGDISASATGSWQVAGRLSYTGIPYSRLQQGTDEAPNPNQLAVDVQLATPQLEIGAPTGTRASLQLPVGRLSTSTISESRTDTDLGDMEVRIRQLLPWLKTPFVELTVGAVLPTGPYVERSGAANLPPEASYLTLGRGVTWALAEAQATLPFAGRYSTYLQLTARTPINRTKDEFDWGSEARAVLGGRAQLPYDLSALAIAELQWRGGASEPDPFAGGRLDSANAGGTWWTLTPALGYAITERLSLLAGVRIPVLSDVKGNQLVPGVGGFVSLSASWSRAPARRARSITASAAVPTPRKGVITVVDYWASWCAPCKTINAELEAAAGGWPDVDIVRVNASGWPDSGPKLPDGAQGLPVIEIFDREGRRTRVLTGKQALKVVTFVNTLRSNGK